MARGCAAPFYNPRMSCCYSLLVETALLFSHKGGPAEIRLLLRIRLRGQEKRKVFIVEHVANDRFIICDKKILVIAHPLRLCDSAMWH